MAHTLHPVGYIIAIEHLICGMGATPEAAWEDFRAEMVKIKADPTPDDGCCTEYPATAALLAAGQCEWTSVDGIACTRAEAA